MFRPLPAVLHQCHSDSTLGEQNSDQSFHLRMETDSHNQRHKSYRGSCCTVTTATDRAGGHHRWLSEIGCWWFGAMVQLSWLLCPLRDREWFSGFQSTLIWLKLSRFMTRRWKRLWIPQLKACNVEKETWRIQLHNNHVRI